jgi:chloride channel 7
LPCVIAATSIITSKKQPLGYTGKTFVRWMFTWGIGFALGILAWFIDHCAKFLNTHRRDMIHDEITKGTHPFIIFMAYAMWNLLFAGSASLLVLFVAPPAASSGIPEVKAILNGIHLHGALSFKCFVAKTLGTIGAVSSGLVLGPEGPLVHLGAMIGSAVTRGEKSIRFEFAGMKFNFGSLKSDYLMSFRNDIERRDFITIGAASGFAAAFGAPIGGVLFALEEASSYWNDKLMWRALTATTMATVTLHVIAGGEDLSNYGLISLKSGLGSYAKNSTTILLPCAIIGCFGGILGALFNACYAVSGSSSHSAASHKFLQTSYKHLQTSPNCPQTVSQTSPAIPGHIKVEVVPAEDLPRQLEALLLHSRVHLPHHLHRHLLVAVRGTMGLP